MKNLRLFWTVSLTEKSDGYYHEWTNWLTGRTIEVFAGYTRRALCRESTTFRTVQERIKIV